MCPGCITNFESDCRGDFESGGTLRQEASCEVRREDARRSQPDGEFVTPRSSPARPKSSGDGVAPIGGDEEMETVAVLASASPLSIITMGTFPLSLIALGHLRRRNFDQTLSLRPKRARNASATGTSPIALASHSGAVSRRSGASEPSSS
jgi:hypothetical protein